MDPLTALSVAGNVIQFVDFGCKVFSKSVEIAQSDKGSTIVHKELEDVTTDISIMARKLRASSSGKGAMDSTISAICEGCTRLADEILTRLSQLETGRSKQIWKTLWMALQHVWSEAEMQGIVRRLVMFKDTLEMHILVDLRDSISLSTLQQSKNFKYLGDQTQYIIAALLDTRDSISKDLQDQTLAITRMLGRREIIIVDQNKKQKSVVLEAVHEEKEISEVEEYLIAEERAIEISEIEENPIAEERAIKRAQRNYNIVWQRTGTAILRGLSYPSLTDRYEQISEAHRKTFEWTFDRFRDGERPWTDLSKWLSNGQGMYWINGKAASGKSTLMRFIVNHNKTTPLLERWAGPIQLCQTSFFFWNSGTMEQRSQTGLLRSLLHDILRKHRELIPVVLPQQWSRSYNQVLDRNEFEQCIWTLPKLKNVFNLLMEQLLVPLKMCLFIDGLDEYEGDWEEIAEFFRGISRLENIKVCVSSRPLQVFEDAFGHCSGMRLQDLTFEDIKLYVGDKLAASPRFKRLRSREPERAPKLVKEIVLKADGVFLWVRLVVQSLREGLGNRDTIQDLQRRLNSLPADLEALYRVLCARIDPFYEEQASQIFQIVRAARMADLDPGLHDTSEEATPMTIFELALAFEKDLSQSQEEHLKYFNLKACRIRCEDMEARLKTRCAGLLEVQGYQRTFHNRANSIVYKWNGRVQYLHRTARDFLESPKEWKAVTCRTSRTDFDAHLALIRSYVLLLRFPALAERELPRITNLIMMHARRYQDNRSEQDPALPFPWLDALDRTMSSRNTAWPPHFLTSLTSSEGNFMSLSIQYGLFDYI